MATATSLKIDEELKQRVQLIAASRQRTAHWIMREAIREYVEREEKREALRNDAIRAWETYQADGKHLTQEEADNWLANLEKGDDTEIPECHS